MASDLLFLNFTVATFTYVNTTTTSHLTRCSNEFINELQLLKINLVYNWYFIQAVKGLDIHKKWSIVWLPLPFHKNKQHKFCLKSVESAHIRQIPRPNTPTPLLCGRHKCSYGGTYATANAWHKWKMVSLLSNFWNQFTVS